MAQEQQKQLLKSDEALHCSEDCLQLLETVRQMIDSEFERRAHERNHNACPANPPPYRNLWQRLMSLFSHSRHNVSP
jgi:hypothetical protein